jgi:hypothetical protein
LINFGIGTGKSFLCASLAIIIRKNFFNNVVILNKSKYLAYRDFNKFKQNIRDAKINVLHNSFFKDSICFWDETFF